MQITSNTNLKKNLIRYLTFVQEKRPKKCNEQYKITSKPKGDRDKEIYSSEEFIAIQHPLKHIELHLPK